MGLTVRRCPGASAVLNGINRVRGFQTLGGVLGVVIAVCCVAIPVVAGAVAIIGFRGSKKDKNSDQDALEVTGNAQDAEKRA